jgi:A/G-specific adenine glycosylase
VAGRAPFSARLLGWYDRHKRDLPWRHTTDPWAIWVSEVMLQQTRVEVVREVYRQFLTRFPEPSTWAQADDGQLLEAWKGLGYYRRARLLRDGARAVMGEHSGVIPQDAVNLGKLPGIGTYTRGAIASIAFGKAEPAIDGNVERVLARHCAIEKNIKQGEASRQVRDTVMARMDRARAGDFNQALMELGATICTPRRPRCDPCPVAVDCIARKRGITASLPRLPARRTMELVRARAALAVLPGGEVLAYRIPQGEINAGQLELPGPGLLHGVDSAKDLQHVLSTRFGASVNIGVALTVVRHGITHHRIELRVHEAKLTGGIGTLLTARPDDPRSPWTTASRKAFAQLDLVGNALMPSPAADDRRA